MNNADRVPVKAATTIAGGMRAKTSLEVSRTSHVRCNCPLTLIVEIRNLVKPAFTPLKFPKAPSLAPSIVIADARVSRAERRKHATRTIG